MARSRRLEDYAYKGRKWKEVWKSGAKILGDDSQISTPLAPDQPASGLDLADICRDIKAGRLKKPGTTPSDNSPSKTTPDLPSRPLGLLPLPFVAAASVLRSPVYTITSDSISPLMFELHGVLLQKWTCWFHTPELDVRITLFHDCQCFRRIPRNHVRLSQLLRHL